MKTLVSVTLLVLMTFTIHEDGGGGVMTRRYQNVSIAPYTLSTGTIIHYQFQNSYNDAATLTFRLTNTKYNQVILYSQSFSRILLRTSTVNIPAYLMDGQRSTLTLSAHSSRFSTITTLYVYPQQHYAINPLLQTTYQTPHSYLTTVNEHGQTIYVRQRVQFQNFTPILQFDTFGKFSLSPLMIKLPDELRTTVTNMQANLLVVNHPHFVSFPLVNNKRVLPLDVILNQHAFNFQFKTIYVDPSTLTIRNEKFTNHVPTQYVYFPLSTYRSLNNIPMQLSFTWTQIHRYTMTYDFTYTGIQPMIGHCHQSLYCVTQTYA